MLFRLSIKNQSIIKFFQQNIPVDIFALATMLSLNISYQEIEEYGFIYYEKPTKLAAEILMPRDRIYKIVKEVDIKNISDLANRFSVSEQAMKIRLESIQ